MSAAPPQIPGYRIIEKHGEGSTAIVWLARQESLDRDVAIKVLKPELLDQIEEVDAFLAEAQSVARLKSRHVIQVFDVGRLGDTVFIVMEYVAGITLAATLRHEGPLPPKRALQIAAAIADAMTDAWSSASMIHRDIKPENIILAEDGGVKLADLGLARITGQGAQALIEGEIAGTPNYMSPEQAAGSANLTASSDMYSLGATLYHMFTGNIPFAGLSAEDVLRAQQAGQLPAVQDVKPGTPLSCCQLVTRLMMKDPALRYPDWTRLLTDLNKLAEGRMLVIKCEAGAMSTIAAVGQSPSSGRKVLRLKKRPQSYVPGQLTPRPRNVPLWLRTPLKVARLSAVIALVWLLLWQPFRAIREQAQMQPQAPLPEQEQDWLSLSTPPLTEELPPPTDPEPDPPAMLPPDDLPDALAEVAPLADPDDQTFEPDPERVDTHRQPPSTGQGNVPASLKHDVVSMLAQDRHRDAWQNWQNWVQTHDPEQASPMTQALSRLLAPETQPTALIASVIERHIGNDVRMIIGNREVRVRPERVDGEVVHAMLHVSSGGSTILRPTEFRISQLPVDEQLRLLENARDPSVPYAKTVLALQNADFPTVLQHADHCGPLADAVSLFAQERSNLLLHDK